MKKYPIPINQLVEIIKTANSILSLSEGFSTQRHAGVIKNDARADAVMYTEPDLVIGKTIAVSHGALPSELYKPLSVKRIASQKDSNVASLSKDVAQPLPYPIQSISSFYTIHYGGKLVFEGSLDGVKTAPPGHLISRLKGSYNRLFRQKTGEQ